jgi:hypothetical protein
MQTIVRLQAICLVLILTLGSVAAPASAQDAVQDPKQPSVDNPHMHFWGDSGLNNCWTHFDGNDSAGSATEGYGEKEFTGNGEQVEIDFTCRIQENFKQDLYLNTNGSIVIDLELQIEHAACSDTQECQDLTLTLYKGTTPVASESFPQIGGSDADEHLRWEIMVADNMSRWNKSSEEPAIQFEFSKPGYTDAFTGCTFFLCGGWFILYYSNNDNNATVEANFPVVNLTEPGGGGGGSIADRVDDALPGFGLAAGLGALALAAVAGSTSRRRDE